MGRTRREGDDAAPWGSGTLRVGQCHSKERSPSRGGVSEEKRSLRGRDLAKEGAPVEGGAALQVAASLLKERILWTKK